MINRLTTLLRNHITYYRSEYGNRHLRLSFGRRFVYVAWGSEVAVGEIEEDE